MPRSFPKNVSASVACGLPGYEGTTTTYILSRSQAELNKAEADGSLNQVASVIVNEFPQWPYDVAAPVSGDAKSFDNLPLDLLMWVCSEGYQTAIKNSISPN